MKAADASADHGKQVFAPLPVGHAINTNAMDVKFDHHALTGPAGSAARGIARTRQPAE